jgi:hypothetical protein
MKYIPIVRDERDVNSDEPESMLGAYDSLKRAEKELADYLQTDNGKHVISYYIQCEN